MTYQISAIDAPIYTDTLRKNRIYHKDGQYFLGENQDYDGLINVVTLYLEQENKIIASFPKIPPYSEIPFNVVSAFIVTNGRHTVSRRRASRLI